MRNLRRPIPDFRRPTSRESQKRLDATNSGLRNYSQSKPDGKEIAVPSSLYFLVCEFLDMTPVSITSTHIDDVLIVRKAQRMSSNVRQEYRSAEDRRAHREEYVQFLETSKYHADVFQRMIDKIQSVADDSDPAPGKVLKQGHF